MSIVSRADIHIQSKNIGHSLRFYIEELNLFYSRQDYGMGQVLLGSLDLEGFCILLKESRDVQPFHGPTTIALGVNNCRAIFDKYLVTQFTSGGGFATSDNKRPSILEYPLGLTFSMHDPSGNRIVLTQWHEGVV